MPALPPRGNASSWHASDIAHANAHIAARMRWWVLFRTACFCLFRGDAKSRKIGRSLYKRLYTDIVMFCTAIFILPRVQNPPVPAEVEHHAREPECLSAVVVDDAGAQGDLQADFRKMLRPRREIWEPIQGPTVGPLKRGHQDAPIDAREFKIQIVEPCSALDSVSPVTDSIMKMVQTYKYPGADG